MAFLGTPAEAGAAVIAVPPEDPEAPTRDTTGDALPDPLGDGKTEISVGEGSAVGVRPVGDALAWGDGELALTEGTSPIQRSAIPCCIALLVSILRCTAV